MECDKCKKLLVDLAYGELSPGEEKKARAHLEECPYCTREYNEIMKTLAAARRLADPQHPAHLDAKIKARAEEVAGKKRSAWSVLMKPGLATAALAVIVASVVVVMSSQRRPPQEMSEKGGPAIEEYALSRMPADKEAEREKAGRAGRSAKRGEARDQVKPKDERDYKYEYEIRQEMGEVPPMLWELEEDADLEAEAKNYLRIPELGGEAGGATWSRTGIAAESSGMTTEPLQPPASVSLDYRTLELAGGGAGDTGMPAEAIAKTGAAQGATANEEAAGKGPEGEPERETEEFAWAPGAPAKKSAEKKGSKKDKAREGLDLPSEVRDTSAFPESTRQEQDIEELVKKAEALKENGRCKKALEIYEKALYMLGYSAPSGNVGLLDLIRPASKEDKEEVRCTEVLERAVEGAAQCYNSTGKGSRERHLKRWHRAVCPKNE